MADGSIWTMYQGDDEPQSRIRLPADQALVQRLAAKLTSRESRLRRLEKIKEAVEGSEYENALKLSVALDRMLDHLQQLGDGTRPK